MLIDDITIKVAAGKGGNGKVSFNKNMMSLGPTGATGGRGGSIYFEGVPDLNALSQFRFKKELVAENGQDGKPQFNDGRDGTDLVIKVPIGTVIHTVGKHSTQEIVSIGQRILIASGGKGGRGNFHFRSATNTTPEEFEPGLTGESYTLRLELKLIADVGFVGLPNVGKSSLLNTLTNAKSKVANYPFTTLEPSLGVYFELVLADIPGLIEGASSGKGLGVKFLRHIERTRILFHFISAESENPLEDYRIIRKELGAYNPALLDKPEYIFLTKTDMATDEIIQDKLALLKDISPKVVAFNLYEDTTLEPIKKILNEIIQTKFATSTTQPS